MHSLQTKKVTSTEVDHAATGEGFRQQSIKRGLSLRQLSRRMKLSAAYLSDLERGRRNWDAELVVNFAKSLK